jgi:hypothetical protein
MALALVRLLSQSTGFDLVVESCEVPCEEAQGGACAPGCEDCLCCPHPRTAMLQSDTSTPAPAVFRAELPELTRPVERASADEIVHIPKRAASV